MQHVIDLRTVESAELEGLWQHEAQRWHERLFWDVSDRIATFKRVLERRGVQGVALRVGTQTVGYAYYVISGRLGILAGLDLLPPWDHLDAGQTLLQAALHALRQHGSARIESPFVSFDCAWLPIAFEAERCRTYWREFLRVSLGERHELPHVTPRLRLEPWREADLPEAAEIMCAAYSGGVDTEMSQLYRTVAGCRLVLEHLLHQRNSGMVVNPASAFVRYRGQGIGFIVITEIARRQGHLAQVVVLPAHQHQGVGQLLLNYSLSQLAALAFDTLSLIVSRGNAGAFRLYQRLGFQPVLTFPVFVWESDM